MMTWALLNTVCGFRRKLKSSCNLENLSHQDNPQGNPRLSLNGLRKCLTRFVLQVGIKDGSHIADEESAYGGDL